MLPSCRHSLRGTVGSLISRCVQCTACTPLCHRLLLVLEQSRLAALGPDQRSRCSRLALGCELTLRCGTLGMLCHIGMPRHPPLHRQGCQPGADGSSPSCVLLLAQPHCCLELGTAQVQVHTTASWHQFLFRSRSSRQADPRLARFAQGTATFGRRSSRALPKESGEAGSRI
jgi:hypothetical protein